MSNKGFVYLPPDCLAAVPIVAGEETLDVLELFASAIANQLSPALRNARLFTEERNIAETLQKALLTVPDKVEGINFGHLYRSATVEPGEVGGDFYDLFELEHDCVGIVIGDIAGKGIEAAALTSLVKNMIKAFAYEQDSPASIMAVANNILLRTTSASMFATVFFGILDSR